MSETKIAQDAKAFAQFMEISPSQANLLVEEWQARDDYFAAKMLSDDAVAETQFRMRAWMEARERLFVAGVLKRPGA